MDRRIFQHFSAASFTTFPHVFRKCQGGYKNDPPTLFCREAIIFLSVCLSRCFLRRCTDAMAKQSSYTVITVFLRFTHFYYSFMAMLAFAHIAHSWSLRKASVRSDDGGQLRSIHLANCLALSRISTYLAV